MKYTIEFGGDPEDVTVTQWGTADLGSLQQFNTDLVGHPRYRGDLLILFENSNLDLSGLSDHELEETAADVVERDWYAPPRAVAIVVLDTPSPGFENSETRAPRSRLSFSAVRCQ